MAVHWTATVRARPGPWAPHQRCSGRFARCTGRRALAVLQWIWADCLVRINLSMAVWLRRWACQRCSASTMRVAPNKSRRGMRRRRRAGSGLMRSSSSAPRRRSARGPGGMARSSPAVKGFLRCFETRTAGASHLRFVLQGVKTGAAARGFACGIGVGYPVAEANDRGELNVMRIVPISSLWQRLRGLFQAVTGSLRIST